MKLTKFAKNRLYIISALIIIFAPAGIYWWLKGPELAVNASGAYVYNRPELSIRDIQLDVFYVVPKNRAVYDFSDLEPKLQTVLERSGRFHQTQFGDKSRIHYRIFPRPVILRNDGIAYDTDDTRFGNPEALKSITLELEARIYGGMGDLWSRNFITPPGYFRVIAIIYEGVGAAGTEGSTILSRDFISRDEYEPIGASLFYHEFAHAIGIPEGYDINTNNPYTNDIMGSGRRAPIETNYIDQATLQMMGVF